MLIDKPSGVIPEHWPVQVSLQSIPGPIVVPPASSALRGTNRPLVKVSCRSRQLSAL